MTKKIGRFADGSLWGFAGVLGDLAAIKLWAQLPLDDPPEVSDDSTLIVVMRSGSVRLWEHSGWVDMEAPFFAEGTGANIARGAMAAGATAKQAVQIAADFDAFTGGPIHELDLGPADEPEDEDVELPAFLAEPAKTETWKQKVGLE